uniref:Uncharacterized protein n=1 Tax=Oryza meridionalis TaxID=40149 RepID=A0A0E0E330_9ORYZ
MDAPIHRLSTKMPDEGSAHLESNANMLSVCNCMLWFEVMINEIEGDCLGPFAIILIKYASDKFEIIAISYLDQCITMDEKDIWPKGGYDSIIDLKMVSRLDQGHQEQTLAIRKMMDRTLNQVDELTLLFRGLNYRRISIVERQYTQRWFQSELIQILDV